MIITPNSSAAHDDSTIDANQLSGFQTNIANDPANTMIAQTIRNKLIISSKRFIAMSLSETTGG